jgi:hypothetical protein
VHKIVSIYVQQVAFDCIPRNQLIILECTVVSEAYASLVPDPSVSSPRNLELRTFMIHYIKVYNVTKLVLNNARDLSKVYSSILAAQDFTFPAALDCRLLNVFLQGCENANII